MYIAVDFDGTICKHRYPEVGQPNDDAIEWMKKFQNEGVDLIILTMRGGAELQAAVDYCAGEGVEFIGHNENPDQSWTTSRKVYAHLYIDDAAFGCPLLYDDVRPRADWSIIGPAVMEIIKSEKELNVHSH